MVGSSAFDPVPHGPALCDLRRGALRSPPIRRSNWRLYVTLTSLSEGDRPDVLFWRTVTDSRALTWFGLNLARCFPPRVQLRSPDRLH